ncbi:MAG: hypothetical protein ACLP36_14925 [Acidimicrobiales bacterium]
MGLLTLGGADTRAHHVGVGAVLAYVAASVVGLWGVAHILPTARVVHGFSDTSRDNRLVVAQEWVAEAMTMWFIAAVVVVATALGSSHQALADWIYRASAIMLLAVAVLTAATGARTAVIFFKICPALLSVTAALLLTASWV